MLTFPGEATVIPTLFCDRTAQACHLSIHVHKGWTHGLPGGIG
jgi:hypothetical protein